MRNKRMDCVFVTACLIILFVFSSVIAAEELVIPDDIFFYSPVASVFGQSSVWTNPAALGNRHQGTMFIFSHRDKRIIRDWGMSATASALATAYRQVNNGNLPDIKEYLIAFGAGQQMKFGASYRYFKEAPGYLNKRHLWNLSLLIQKSKKVSLGGRVENLNRGRIDGKRSDIRYVYGVAARAYRDIVTVSFEVDMTQKENFDNADFRTGIEVRPMPGMYIYADCDNHSRVNLGFRLNFGSGYVGHYHNFDRDVKSYRSTSYVGTVKGRQPSITKPRRKSMIVRLDGTLPENRKVPFFGKKPARYFDYVHGIYRAADDDEIDRLFLNIGTLKCGLGKVEELSNAVGYFGSRGKKVFAYLNNPNNLGYLLGSSADSVIIPPVSQVNLIGLRANLMSIKGLMDKVGVDAEIERVDEYKTAPEMYMYDQPTDPNRKQVNRILDNLYADMVDRIAINRNLDADSVTRLIDAAPLTSEDAVEYGLVDEMSYLDDAIKKYAGSDVPFLSRQISLQSYIGRENYEDRWGRPEHLAIIIADGDIKEGNSGGKMGDYEMLGVIKRVRNDNRIKGVVLRINSPGGSALASDLIWNEIDKTARKKPLVISMGNMAASGGYYISTVDGEIFVNRNTITGSIGVYGGKVNVSELLDKIGIYTESYSRGRNASIYSPYEPFTEEQRLQLRDQMRRFYIHFTEKVGVAREITPDSVNTIGRGQVWTGSEAISNGLADRLGGIFQALRSLCEKSGVLYDDAEIVSYPEKKFIIQNPFDIPTLYQKLSTWIGGAEREFAASDLINSDYIFYRMPYSIEIE